MTKKNEFRAKPEYARELLNVAEQDFDTANILLENFNRVRAENIGFHLQQSVEKALKAVLCSKGKPIPLNHNLKFILGSMSDLAIPEEFETLTDLTPFATAKLYEEGHEIIEQSDVEAAAALNRRVLKWAKENIRNV